jgi:hypothetical protein
LIVFLSSGERRVKVLEMDGASKNLFTFTRQQASRGFQFKDAHAIQFILSFL